MANFAKNAFFSKETFLLGRLAPFFCEKRRFCVMVKNAVFWTMLECKLLIVDKLSMEWVCRCEIFVI